MSVFSQHHLDQDQTEKILLIFIQIMCMCYEAVLLPSINCANKAALFWFTLQEYISCILLYQGGRMITCSPPLKQKNLLCSSLSLFLPDLLGKHCRFDGF